MEPMWEKRKKLGKWLIGIVAACILIFLGVQNIASVANAISWITSLMAPLIVGFALALVLNVPMRALEERIWKKTARPVFQRLRRPVCFLIALAMIIGILIGVVWLVIPELINALIVIVQGAIRFLTQVSSMSDAEIEELPFGTMLKNIDWDRLLESAQSWLKNRGGAIVNTAFGTVTSLVNGVFDLFISIVFAIYILFSKEKLKLQACRLVRAWLPKKFGANAIHAAAVANVNFRNFISGQSLEAVILGVLCMIGMLILKIPYAPMVGALVGVTALVPVVGAFIGIIVGAFMILTVDPSRVIVFVIYLLVLQQIEGNLIYPKVMGSKVNLPGMWILAAVTIGGGIGGALGMLLSVPVASTAYVLIKEATQKRETAMTVSEEAAESPTTRGEEQDKDCCAARPLPSRSRRCRRHRRGNNRRK